MDDMLEERPDTATKMLRDEHVLILKVVDALERSLGSPDTTLGPDVYDGVERCISFFRLYTDVCHHGKEEDLLFPELLEQGIPEEGPVAVLLDEHRQGRALVARMTAAAAAARSGEVSAELELRTTADEYIDLIRRHIDKEDNGLFDMADSMVVGESCRRLCGEYAAVCARRFEGQSLEDLERLASDLAAG